MQRVRGLEPRWKEYPATVLAPLAPGQRKEVTYRVGYTYNGGTIIDGEWYSGWKVPPPVVPENHELRDMAVGLQLNAHPPYATEMLVNTQ